MFIQVAVNSFASGSTFLGIKVQIFGILYKINNWGDFYTFANVA
jgi:hypothetical protein